MFALEIMFRDGISEPETIFVRRPQALIGASDYSHVVVDDMADLDYQLRLVRDLGRTFRSRKIPVGEQSIETDHRESIHDGSAQIDAGQVSFFVTSLDLDLVMRENESPDRAGVRVLRRASAVGSPMFPALSVGGNDSMILSFVPDQPVYIGRSKQCEVRLDAADISARHARMGYESSQFWVEDLGSTNGTFVNGQQISGRVNVPPGAPVILGRDVSIVGVNSDEQIRRAADISKETVLHPAPQQQRYPVIVSASEVARPARCALVLGQVFNVGRDPQSDMWLGAPHVSRRHSSLSLDESGDVVVTDFSTNGTSYGEGILKRGDQLILERRSRVLDFGGGLTVGICFSEEDEKDYLASQGAPHIFLSSAQGKGPAGEKHNPKLIGRSDFGSVDRKPTVDRPIGSFTKLALLYSSLGARGKLAVFMTLMAIFLVFGILGILLGRLRF